MDFRLRHADLGTTQIYTKVVNAQLGEAVFRLPSAWEEGGRSEGK